MTFGPETSRSEAFYTCTRSLELQHVIAMLSHDLYVLRHRCWELISVPNIRGWAIETLDMRGNRNPVASRTALSL